MRAAKESSEIQTGLSVAENIIATEPSERTDNIGGALWEDHKVLIEGYVRGREPI